MKTNLIKKYRIEVSSKELNDYILYLEKEGYSMNYIFECALKTHKVARDNKISHGNMETFSELRNNGVLSAVITKCERYDMIKSLMNIEEVD